MWIASIAELYNIPLPKRCSEHGRAPSVFLVERFNLPVLKCCSEHGRALSGSSLRSTTFIAEHYNIPVPKCCSEHGRAPIFGSEPFIAEHYNITVGQIIRSLRSSTTLQTCCTKTQTGIGTDCFQNLLFSECLLVIGREKLGNRLFWCPFSPKADEDRYFSKGQVLLIFEIMDLVLPPSAEAGIRARSGSIFQSR